jgi:hypothetical protein
MLSDHSLVDVTPIQLLPIHNHSLGFNIIRHK